MSDSSGTCVGCGGTGETEDGFMCPWCHGKGSFDARKVSRGRKVKR